MFNIYRMFFLALKKIQMVKITPHQILTTRQPTPLAKSAYFYMDMNCFRLVRVVWSWLRVSLVAVDSFGWVFSDGCRWFQVVSEGFGWFAILVVTFFIFLWFFLVARGVKWQKWPNMKKNSISLTPYFKNCTSYYSQTCLKDHLYKTITSPKRSLTNSPK